MVALLPANLAVVLVEDLRHRRGEAASVARLDEDLRLAPVPRLATEALVSIARLAPVAGLTTVARLTTIAGLTAVAGLTAIATALQRRHIV